MQTLPPYYPAKFVMKWDGTCKGMDHIDLWRFKSDKSGRRYFIEVESYENHIYAIKFYPRDKRYSKDRYSYRTGDFEARRIVLTCIMVMREYFSTDPLSSFAFVGSHQEDEGMANSKRFRVYSRMVSTYIGNRNFVHFSDTDRSAYVLARRILIENDTLTIKDINDYFENIYLFD